MAIPSDMQGSDTSGLLDQAISAAQTFNGDVAKALADMGLAVAEANLAKINLDASTLLATTLKGTMEGLIGMLLSASNSQGADNPSLGMGDAKRQGYSSDSTFP